MYHKQRLLSMGAQPHHSSKAGSGSGSPCDAPNQRAMTMIANTGIPKVRSQGANGPAFVAVAPSRDTLRKRSAQAPFDQLSPKPANPNRHPKVHNHLCLSHGRRQISTIARIQSAAHMSIISNQTYPSRPRAPRRKSFSFEGLSGQAKRGSRRASAIPATLGRQFVQEPNRSRTQPEE